MYRESRGLRQGGKIRAYGGSRENLGRNRKGESSGRQGPQRPAVLERRVRKEKSCSVHRTFSAERERGVREVAHTKEHLTVGESVSRAEGTCRQAESFALYWVETLEVGGGCQKVDTTSEINFGERERERFVEAEESCDRYPMRGAKDGVEDRDHGSSAPTAECRGAR